MKSTIRSVAGICLLVALFYTALAGAPVPAQRSCAMAGFALLPSNLESNTNFSAASGAGQSLNDTFLQIAQAFATFYGDGSGGTNAEKISRLARGS
jgi:hypothetical protein